MDHIKNILLSQKSLEKEQVTMGKSRYQKEVVRAIETNQEAVTKYGVQFLGAGGIKITARLKEILDDYNAGKALVYPFEAMVVLEMLPLNVITFLAFKTCINYMSVVTPVQKVAIEISTLIEDEFRLRNFKSLAPALVAVIQRDIKEKKTTNYRRQKTILNASARKAGIHMDRLPPRVKAKLGVMLIDIISQETGLFTSVRTTTAPNRTPILFQGTAKALKWINKKNSICELLNPTKLPMVIRPKPWTSMFDGGYYDIDMCLVKSLDQEFIRQLDIKCGRGEMDEVLSATNTLQNTEWQINKGIYETMKYFRDNEISVPVLPDPHDMAKDPFPEGGTVDEIVTWKRGAVKVHNENMKRKTKRIQQAQLMWVAGKFKDYPKFYFPHTLDFRGRAYASSNFLNPQAEDTGRSLLEFREGRPLGGSGESWLAVHGANCWGYDKVSLEERVEWVYDNQADIESYGRAPTVWTGWMKADKPWQFLAFCMDWYAKEEHADAESYVSRLPIAVDGSCNGLQHFSAMLRDEIGGKAVNLTPTEQPQDIYQIVADEVNKVIPAPWSGIVDRTLTKRNVMTFPYGATLWGMRAQLNEEIFKQHEKGRVFPFDMNDIWPHANQLASYVLASIGDTVVAAKEAMSWLQGVARATNAAGMGSLYWTTPAGFMVKQGYLKPLKKQVKTVLNGKFAFLHIQSQTDNLDRIKQVQGIAPNFVHSMDAAHLMKTLNSAILQGMDAFHVVHDSFGVHAGDVEAMSTILKEEFIDIYKADILEDFRQEILKQKEGLVLTPTPEYGTLDLSQIIHADFFFC
jgi:DNA-directed RNA polymerase, mitochondrial